MTIAEAYRQPGPSATRAIAGRNSRCPLAPAAEKIPITRPRCRTNQRLATIAPKTRAIAPVPTPTASPQSSHSCQAWVMTSVRPEPIATSVSEATTTRRMPKRSISAAANGAVTPYRTRLSVTAPLVVARDQPKSSSRGSSSAPVDERNPAAATRAPMVIAATNHARWIRRVR